MHYPTSHTANNAVYNFVAQGDFMDNIKDAKRSVAVKACKMLWENGELDNHLLPITKSKCLENVKDIYFPHWDDEAADNGMNSKHVH